MASHQWRYFLGMVIFEEMINCDCFRAAQLLWYSPNPFFKSLIMSLTVGCRWKGATLSLSVWGVGRSQHGSLCVLGASSHRCFQVFLHEQGPGGSTVGPKEGQQEAHDLPEDVARPEELRPVRRDLQGEEEAHLPIQQRDADVTAEVSTRRFVTWTRFCASHIKL